MSNKKRIYKDSSGNMFIPMNVEGRQWDDEFINTKKLMIIIGLIIIGVLLVMWLKGRYAGVSAYITILGLYLLITQYIVRKVVIEENFYYDMYERLKKSEITTPALFWGIISVRESTDGALLTYADGKVGIIVRLERDTITGKTEKFKEYHYNSISNFYKELTNRRYEFVQMNIMEQAGNDVRLLELDKLILKNNNKNIIKLMEMQIGYIKNITHKTLYETDYLLIYTTDLNRIDNLVMDVVDSMCHLMGGAYIGFKILTINEIIGLSKEKYGVKYFNYTDATLETFRKQGIISGIPLEIKGIQVDSGNIIEVDDEGKNKINILASKILEGTIKPNKIAIKDTILSINSNKNNDGVDFYSLSEGFEVNGKDEKIDLSGSGSRGRVVNLVKNVKHRKWNKKVIDSDGFGGENGGNVKVSTLDIRKKHTVVKNEGNIEGKKQHKIENLDVGLVGFENKGEEIDF